MAQKKKTSISRKKSSKPATKQVAPVDASALITKHVRELGDWRGEKLAVVRTLIREADPDVVEQWKWDVPVWSHDGIICTGETYKQVVKLTFPKGASLQDDHGLFNAGFGGKVRRAIDIGADDEINPAAFKALIREAVAQNRKAEGAGPE